MLLPLQSIALQASLAQDAFGETSGRFATATVIPREAWWWRCGGQRRMAEALGGLRSWTNAVLHDSRKVDTSCLGEVASGTLMGRATRNQATAAPLSARSVARRLHHVRL